MSDTIKNGFLISEGEGTIYQIPVQDRYELRDVVERLITSGVNYREMYYSKVKLKKISIKNIGIKECD